MRLSGIAAMLLWAVWWLSPGSGTDEDRSESFHETVSVATLPTDETPPVPADKEAPEEHEIATTARLPLGQAIATTVERTSVLEISAIPDKEPSDHDQQRFPSSRVIERVHLEPPGWRMPWIEQPEAIRVLILPLPGGDSVEVDVLHHEQRSPSRGTFIAHARDDAYSEVVVSYYDEAMTASIIIPERGHFEITYAGEERHLLIEVDPDLIEQCGGALRPDVQLTDHTGKEPL